MENASKALLMAGEILIGIIIISIFAWIFGKTQEFAEGYNENMNKQKIVAFNNQYTQYITNNTDTDATYIYAEDVVTIANQARDWNETTPNEDEKITVMIIMEDRIIVATTGTFNEGEFLEEYKLRDTPEKPEYKFSCEVELNEKTGRVSRVTIETT